MFDATDSKTDSFSDLIEALSLVFLGIFLATVLTKVFPLRPFNPGWQLSIVGELINNGSIALVGALLMPLALHLNPTSERLRRRRNAFRKYALVACIGFLLLIPLQASAVWRLFSGFTSRADQQATLSARKVTELRQAIASAKSPEELQSRLTKIIGNNAALTPAQLRTPLSELKTILLSQTERISNRIQQGIQAQAAAKPDRLVQESIRISLTSLLYATGFGYFAGVLPLKAKGKRKMAFGWSSAQRR
jgi:hypothetical protein